MLGGHTVAAAKVVEWGGRGHNQVEFIQVRGWVACRDSAGLISGESERRVWGHQRGRCGVIREACVGAIREAGVGPMAEAGVGASEGIKTDLTAISPVFSRWAPSHVRACLWFCCPFPCWVNALFCLQRLPTSCTFPPDASLLCPERRVRNAPLPPWHPPAHAPHARSCPAAGGSHAAAPAAPQHRAVSGSLHHRCAH